MDDDPIIAELRKIRDDHAREFNYDIKAIVEDLQKKEQEHTDKLVTREPRRILKKTG